MNSYRAHISAFKRQQLLRHFCADTTAAYAAGVSKVSRNTANHWFRYFRQCILDSSPFPRFSGEVECDHTFFGATGPRRFHLVHGKKVLLRRQKFLVFGLLLRDPSGVHRVRTIHIKRADINTLLPPIYLIVEKGSRIYTDSWRSFNPLGVNGYVHKTVNHRKKQFMKKDGDFSVHTGTIDQYFKYCKQRLGKFCRLYPTTLELHLRECEFRYNHRHDLEKALKALI